MPRFFTTNISEDQVFIEGEDAAHLTKVLRAKAGDEIIVCDMAGTDYVCSITQLDKSCVTAEILSSAPCEAEPKSKITLYQSLPKGDKMELIVQKAVELGVCEIVPVITKRCVSRPDSAALKKKTDRWQKIAAEAAKQSGRGIIPQVKEAVSYQQALQMAGDCPRKILFYEQATVPLKGLLANPAQTAVFIGPEGGYEEEEVAWAKEAGVNICTLGKRILRCETAPMAALAIILASEELL